MPSLEEIGITGARALVLPLLLNFAAASPPSQSNREVTVVVNARTGTIAFLQGAADGFEAVLRKGGQLPATKASIEALPVVKVGEEGVDCAICLSELELGGDGKVMPCKHRYHPDCIDKWLKIHGSCPICRFQMPGEVDPDLDDDSESLQDRVDMVFHVFFRTGSGDSSDSESDHESEAHPGGAESDEALNAEAE
ncbi:unnamed protein product [Cuscuta epithymum]|uniref:RING-type E3 ubiquitin transferase n=1 Tax=Cuscuta epithymum TaxID=186058 RepID=A0AAV0DJI9_9ASTE|nr:unnamed protein product [Cuscuta epithymum]